MKLRKVMILEKTEEYKYSEISGRAYPVKIEYKETDKFGYFHQWTSEFGCNEIQKYFDVHAIVELMDGTVEIVNSDLIKFVEDEK